MRVAGRATWVSAEFRKTRQGRQAWPRAHGHVGKPQLCSNRARDRQKSRGSTPTRGATIALFGTSAHRVGMQDGTSFSKPWHILLACYRSLAGRTVSRAPPSFEESCSDDAAASAALSFAIVTNPNPRERPVTLSHTMEASTTAPYSANTVCKAFVVVFGPSPATYNLQF